MEEVAANAGVQFNHIPFKGSADLMAAPRRPRHGGERFDRLGTARRVRQGAPAGDFRLEAHAKWPDVPTLDELGYKTVSDSPFGLVGPAGMEPAIVNTLSDAFRKALEDPKVKELLDRFDQPVIYMGPSDYTAWARKMWEAERGTIERLGLKNSL